MAEVGSYNPHTKEVVLDKETVKKYLSNGAQPSGRVIRILKSQKVTLPKWVKVAPEKSAKAKHADKLRKNQPKEETPAEAPASEESPAEAPAEEKSAEVSAE